MTPYIPFWVKVAMFAAFFAIMGAWAWLVNRAVYHWLPKWIVVPVGFAFIALAIGMYSRDAFLWWQDRRRRRLPRRPKQARGIVADDLPLRADRD